MIQPNLENSNYPKYLQNFEKNEDINIDNSDLPIFQLHLDSKENEILKEVDLTESMKYQLNKDDLNELSKLNNLDVKNIDSLSTIHESAQEIMNETKNDIQSLFQPDLNLLLLSKADSLNLNSFENKNSAKPQQSACKIQLIKSESFSPGPPYHIRPPSPPKSKTHLNSIEILPIQRTEIPNNREMKKNKITISSVSDTTHSSSSSSNKYFPSSNLRRLANNDISIQSMTSSNSSIGSTSNSNAGFGNTIKVISIDENTLNKNPKEKILKNNDELIAIVGNEQPSPKYTMNIIKSETRAEAIEDHKLSLTIQEKITNNMKTLQFEAEIADFITYIIQNTNILFEKIPMIKTQVSIFHKIHMGLYNLLMIIFSRFENMILKNENIFNLDNWESTIQSELYQIFSIKIQSTVEAFKLLFDEYLNEFDELYFRLAQEISELDVLKLIKHIYADYNDINSYMNQIMNPIIIDALKFLSDKILDPMLINEQTIFIVVNCLNMMFVMDKVFHYEKENDKFFNFIQFYDNHKRNYDNQIMQKIIEEMELILANNYPETFL